MVFSKSPTPPPPVKRAAKPKPPAEPSAKQKERETAVNGILQTASLACVMTGNVADSGALSMHGPKVAHELARVAEDNEPIGNALDYLNKVGPYTGLIVAMMPLVLQLAVNHGMGNAGMLGNMGVVAPAVLESKVKADMMRMAAEQAREQREAEAQIAADLAELQAQMESASV